MAAHMTVAPRPPAVRELARATASLDVERIRGEFVEMPGFSPTLLQAARLFCLPHDECARVLAQLQGEGFVRQTRAGRFRLATE